MMIDKYKFFLIHKKIPPKVDFETTKSHLGILSIGVNDDPPKWWWDANENVCLFGDLNLRMFVPSTDYNDENF